MISVLFTIAVIAFLLFGLGASYRRIVRLRGQVSHAWKRLDELIKKRIEIIGKTLELATNAGIQGAELDRLAHAHARAAPYRGPAEAGRRNAELDNALNQLLSLMGQHSGVGGALRAISEDLNAVSAALLGAGNSYNDRAATYNRAMGAAPGNLISGLAGFHRAERFG